MNNQYPPQANHPAQYPAHPDAYNRAGGHQPISHSNAARYGSGYAPQNHAPVYSPSYAQPQPNHMYGAQQYGYAHYGSLTINVGQDGWTDALKEGMKSGQTIDLVFDASQWQHYLDEYLNPALSAAGLQTFAMGYDPSSRAHAMALPALAVVAIVIAALIALVAVVSLVSSSVISYHAMDKCYGVEIIEGGEASGSGSNSGSGSSSGARVVKLTPGTCRR